MQKTNTFFLLLALLSLSFNLHADTCNWVGNTDNNWETASNWSCGNVPTANDEVFIYGGEITISTAVEVGSIQFQQTASLLLSLIHI